jgi:hypothetical protein
LYCLCTSGTKIVPPGGTDIEDSRLNAEAPNLSSL